MRLALVFAVKLSALTLTNTYMSYCRDMRGSKNVWGLFKTEQQQQQQQQNQQCIK